jgi:signal peptidase I
MKRRVSSLRNALGVCLLGMLVGIYYLIQTHRIVYYEVTSDSMAPTLQAGDRLLMSPAHELARGDIVIFKKPEVSSETLVKRLIAIGPDRVESRDGQLFVNGLRADPPSGPAPPDPPDDRSWDLAPGRGFVAGDNRGVSLDSRDYGPIELDAVMGIATVRVEPQARRGFIQ